MSLECRTIKAPRSRRRWVPGEFADYFLWLWRAICDPWGRTSVSVHCVLAAVEWLLCPGTRRDDRDLHRRRWPPGRRWCLWRCCGKWKCKLVARTNDSAAANIRCPLTRWRFYSKSDSVFCIPFAFVIESWRAAGRRTDPICRRCQPTPGQWRGTLWPLNGPRRVNCATSGKTPVIEVNPLEPAHEAVHLNNVKSHR